MADIDINVAGADLAGVGLDPKIAYESIEGEQLEL